MYKWTTNLLNQEVPVMKISKFYQMSPQIELCLAFFVAIWDKIFFAIDKIVECFLEQEPCEEAVALADAIN